MENCRTDVCTLSDQEGRSRSFHYALTVQRVGGIAEYGIRISEEGGAAAFLPQLTGDAARADELMALLVRNGVGPAGLEDVVADWKQCRGGEDAAAG